MRIIETTLYIGFNRWAEVPLSEQFIELEPAELAGLSAGAAEIHHALSTLLLECGVTDSATSLQSSASVDDPQQSFCSLYTQTAVALQNACGHRVAFTDWHSGPVTSQCTALYEYEQPEVGTRSGELALELLHRAWPMLQREERAENGTASLQDLMHTFRQFAEPLALLADTRAIITAAARRDIPCIKLDRPPFEIAADDTRIRLHSTVQTGYGRYQHLLDSNFCIDRCGDLWPLVRDRVAALRLLGKLGLPLASKDSEPRSCSTASRARRIAKQLGYPLKLRPAIKIRGGQGSVTIDDEDALSAAFHTANYSQTDSVLEPLVSGKGYKILVAGQQLLAIVACRGAPAANTDISHQAHPSLVDNINRVVSAIDVGILVLTLVSPDISAPLAESGAAFVDLDIAPELDRFLEEDSPLLASAADALIAWLYPAASQATIPLVAVTGTNGKTTTSRLIYSALKQDGRSPGLACTDGIYHADGKASRLGDLSGLLGHYPLLVDPTLDCAVLETARGGILNTGLAFSHCHIGVCVNISEDHLELRGIHTVEQMARVKRSVLERARDGVVLNADDVQCVAMLPFPSTDRIALVSMVQDKEALWRQYGTNTCLALLESIAGEEYLVIYDREEKRLIASVNEIPATFNGTARHNICNALHASAACHLMGVQSVIIRSALCQFQLTYDNAPGRLNFYEELPFRVLVDYAHNPAGAEQLCQFLDTVVTPGRKFLLFSGNSNVSDYSIEALTEIMAGHFDRFFCFMYAETPEERYEQVVNVVVSTLERCGIQPEHVHWQDTCVEAVGAAFAEARVGDLVVVIPGGRERQKVWERISTHK